LVGGAILQYSVIRAIQEIEHILHFRAETGSFHGDQIIRATPISHESSPIDYDHGYDEKIAGHVEMLNLILLRHYTVFWVLNTELAAIIHIGLDILTRTQPLQLSSTPLPESEKTKVWGTALSLAFLSRAIPHLKSRWGVIVSKSEMWMNSIISEFIEGGSNDIITCAEETLIERKIQPIE